MLTYNVSVFIMLGQTILLSIIVLSPVENSWQNILKKYRIICKEIDHYFARNYDTVYHN